MHIGIKRILMIVMACVLALLAAGCNSLIARDIDADFFDSSEDSQTFWGGLDGQGGTLEAGGPSSDLPSWTVMIYMVGSNLESQGGEATTNLLSLLSVDLPDAVNVVIYTGGTSQWQNDTISAAHNQIWHVEAGELVLDESIDAQSMGDSRTLAAFIDYAQSQYPAQKKALFMWNHGGGSIMGFGEDELFDGDGLYLAELSDAFALASDGQKFDVVGFDACLMASVETACVLAPYADYLVASEEIEPGGGWNYEYTYGQLAQNPDMTGLELGTAVTDGYYDKYARTTMEGIVTCSVIDLGRIPALEDAMSMFFADLSGSIVAPEAMVSVSTTRQQTESFGEDPTAVPLDMVDLYDFVTWQTEADANLTQSLLSAIEDAVVYEVSGSQRMYSYGLSVYFPFFAKEYFDYNLAIYNTLDFCPEYRTFVGDFSGQLTNDTYLDDVPEYDVTDITSVPVDDYSEEGSFYVQLTDDQLEYLSEVYCVLGWYQDNGTLVDLGYDSDLTIDWSDNTIHDSYDGCWTLMNGQPVAVFVMDEVVDEYIVYNIPILYNGELAVVKGAWVWDDTYDENGYYMVNGVFYTNDEYSPPNTKLSIELTYGDEITPVYPVLYPDGAEEYWYGEPFYLNDDGLYLEWDYLPDGDYEYGFMFVDVYGEIHYSDFIIF